MLVRRHRADDSVTRAIARILRADLIVVDDIGLLPVAHDAAEGLCRLVDAAYDGDRVMAIVRGGAQAKLCVVQRGRPLRGQAARRNAQPPGPAVPDGWSVGHSR